MSLLKSQIKEDKFQIILISVLTSIAILLQMYFQFILKTDIIFSHFFYIPIILSCIWWKKKGLILTTFLVSLLIILPIFLNQDIFNIFQVENLLRAFLLIVVSIVVTILSERISKTEYSLKERVKELNCIYDIITSINDPNNSLEEILISTLDKIRCAWQFPKLICVKIHFDGKEYKTENFVTTPWKMSKEVFIKQRKLGIDLHYIEEQAFLKEEESLLEEILQQLKAVFDLKLTWIK